VIKKLTIGSRDSKLALVQTEWVRDELLEAYPGLEIQIKEIKTQGDKILDLALSKIGDKALFTKELENELLAGTIDLAVHSMKDLPTQLPEGLEIVCTSLREDVRDVVCFSEHARARNIESIDQARVIATSSLRRIAQLKGLYPDKEFVDIRGNLQTRFKKLNDPENNIDALILAAAGIHRLGEENLIDEYLDPHEIFPAVGQGALALEIKSGRDDLREFLRDAINSERDEYMVMAERSFLRRLEGGCQVPIGVYSEEEEGSLVLQGIVSSLDGVDAVAGLVGGPITDAEELGIELAEMLLEEGADELLSTIRH
jgi:hydroxymethylbilane synthase